MTLANQHAVWRTRHAAMGVDYVGPVPGIGSPPFRVDVRTTSEPAHEGRRPVTDTVELETREGVRVMVIGPRLRNWLRNRPLLHRASSYVVVRLTGPYEERFERALMRSLQGARCFWDVGANVGEYVVKAREQVSVVVAIEPSAACCAELRALPDAPVVIEAALSDEDGVAEFSVAAGPLAVSNHLTRTHEQGGVGVRTARGDTLVAQGLPAPDVMKIDVEGFEGEVLDGMPLLLRDPRLRTICLEVHFAQLHERGKSHEPARIVKLLREAGFRVRWVDPSHLVATRRCPAAA